MYMNNISVRCFERDLILKPLYICDFQVLKPKEKREKTKKKKKKFQVPVS